MLVTLRKSRWQKYILTGYPAIPQGGGQGGGHTSMKDAPVSQPTEPLQPTEVLPPQPETATKRSRPRMVKVKVKAPATSDALGDQAPSKALTVEISEKIKHALQEIANKGATQAQAAETAGISVSWLQECLSRPEVRAFLSDLQDKRKLTLRSKALQTVDRLMDGAKSQRVQLEAAKVVLELPEPNAGASVAGIELSIDFG